MTKELLKEKPKPKKGQTIIEVDEGGVIVGYETITGEAVPKLPLQRGLS